MRAVPIVMMQCGQIVPQAFQSPTVVDVTLLAQLLPRKDMSGLERLLSPPRQVVGKTDGSRVVDVHVFLFVYPV